MDLEKLKYKLELSTKMLKKSEDKLKNQVNAEVDSLEKLIEYLAPSLPIEFINGKKSVLIYVYENSNKHTISNKVYYCEDNLIRYQVFKKDDYLQFNPSAKFDGSYVEVEPFEHFYKRNGLELADVVSFFEERVEVLPVMAEKIYESTAIREDFLKTFKKLSKRWH